MPLLVAAASSLTDVLQTVARQFTARTRISVRFTFGASGTLARQIQAGAPVDVFVSAAPKEIDDLQKAGLLLPDTRRTIAANRLVLIAPRLQILPGRWEDLLSPQVRRIALAKPETVPAGRYAKETLTRRGLWEAVQAKAIYGANVRQVLTYVAGGNVDAGIVFRTDALSEKRVRIVVTAIPRRDHAPIVYLASVLARTTDTNAARQFAEALTVKDAQAVFARYGFLPPSEAV